MGEFVDWFVVVFEGEWLVLFCICVVVVMMVMICVDFVLLGIIYDVFVLEVEL